MWACIPVMLFFLSRQASPCSSSSAFLLFCPVALECIKYIAGSHLVICLRTVSASPFKTNSWGRNSSSAFFTKSHFVILMAFTWVDPVSLPHIFCYDAEGSSRTPSLPRLPQSESSRRPHLSPGARPKLHFRSSGHFSSYNYSSLCCHFYYARVFFFHPCPFF